MNVPVASAIKVEGAKYGITFSRKSSNSPLTVREIRSESPFRDQGLAMGMVVIRINGQDMTWASPKDAAKSLQRCQVGTMMSVEAAEVIVATAKKESKNKKCGIWLTNSSSAAGVFISRINNDGLFAQSGLKPGMRVIKINETNTMESFHDAAGVLKASEGEVKVIAIHSLAPITTKDGTQPPSILKKVSFSFNKEIRPELEETSSEEGSLEEKLEQAKALQKKTQRQFLLESMFPWLVNL